jgi:O-antigen/teichoic acid export membrane protein
LWSWLGLTSNIISGLLLTPFVLKRLGSSAYGVWTLVFALTETAWLFDFGIRSATAHFTSRAHAWGDHAEFNRILNTSTAFFTAAGTVVAGGVTLILAFRLTDRLFQIPSEFVGTVRILLMLAAGGWIGSAVFTVFDASLEGMGRFDVLTRIAITFGLVRSIVSIVALSLGGSLVTLGAITASTQILASASSCVMVKRVAPWFRFSLSSVERETFKRLLAYGGPALLVSVAIRIVFNSGALVVGHYYPPAYVAYLAVPMRIVQLLLEPVTRIGAVVRFRVAAWGAGGPANYPRIVELVDLANRYSTALVLAAAVVLIPLAHQILALWATPDLASHSTPILRILIVGVLFGQGSQFCSGAGLFGLGRHRMYSLSAIFEAVAGTILMILFARRGGVVSIAVISACMMVLVRGFITSSLFCNRLGMDWVRFCRFIYVRPLILAVPVGLLGFLCSPNVPPRTAWTLLVMAACLCLLYLLLAFRYCLRPSERSLIFVRLSALLAK